MSPFINSLVALSVSAYLAAMSCAGSDMNYEPDKFVEDEASDDGYIISAEDLNRWFEMYGASVAARMAIKIERTRVLNFIIDGPMYAFVGACGL